MKQKHKKLKRFSAILLAVITVFSMIPLSGITAFAAEPETAKVNLTLGDELKYASNIDWTTHIQYADGKMAYCVNPKLPAPSGTFSTSSGNMTEISNDLLRKALYYCYGGDGFNASNNAFKTDTSKHQQKYSGNTMAAFMGNLKYTSGGFTALTPSGSNLHYLLTHRVLALIYGDSDWDYALNSDWTAAVKEIKTALEKAPSAPTTYKIYVLTPGGGKQNVILLKNTVKLQLQKVSANPDLTNGNSCYSLKGARYNIYLDKACTEYFSYIVTDETGYGQCGSGNGGKAFPEQTYYAKEVEASKGFELDSINVYTFKNSGKTSEGVPVYTITCKETPINDPVDILLQKKDSETGEAVPQGGGEFENAEFTVKYYDGYYSTESELPKTPVRSWVLKTDEYGYIELDEKHRVSGDEFYYDETGSVAFPYGTITIQETAAPPGYELDARIHTMSVEENNLTAVCEVTENSLNDIAQALGLKRSSVIKTVGELVGMGLIKKYRIKKKDGSFSDNHYKVVTFRFRYKFRQKKKRHQFRFAPEFKVFSLICSKTSNKAMPYSIILRGKGQFVKRKHKNYLFFVGRGSPKNYTSYDSTHFKTYRRKNKIKLYLKYRCNLTIHCKEKS